MSDICDGVFGKAVNCTRTLIFFAKKPLSLMFGNVLNPSLQAVDQAFLKVVALQFSKTFIINFYQRLLFIKLMDHRLQLF